MPFIYPTRKKNRQKIGAMINIPAKTALGSAFAQESAIHFDLL